MGAVSSHLLNEGRVGGGTEGGEEGGMKKSCYSRWPTVSPQQGMGGCTTMENLACAPADCRAASLDKQFAGACVKLHLRL